MIQDDARRIAEEEIGLAGWKFIGPREDHELFHRVRRRLSKLKKDDGSKKYKSWTIWWFVLRTLIYVLMEVIEKHNAQKADRS